MTNHTDISGMKVCMKDYFIDGNKVVNFVLINLLPFKYMLHPIFARE